MSGSDTSQRSGSATILAEDAKVLDATRTLRWPARRIVAAGFPGAHRSRALGSASEVVELRAYRQGDELRRLDWKVLARTDRPFIRLAPEHAVAATSIIVDATGSQAFPAPLLDKWRTTRQLTLALMAAAQRAGDPVGVTIVPGSPERPRLLAPRTRRGLVDDAARLFASVTPTGDAPLAPAMRTASRRTSVGATIITRLVVVSDMLGDLDAMLGVARELASAGCELTAVHVVHPRELDPPSRATLWVDPEGGGDERSMPPVARERYLSVFADWRNRLARSWRRLGAYYVEAVTAVPSAEHVRRVVGGTSASAAPRGTAVTNRSRP